MCRHIKRIRPGRRHGDAQGSEMSRKSTPRAIGPRTCTEDAMQRAVARRKQRVWRKRPRQYVYSHVLRRVEEHILRRVGPTTCRNTRKEKTREPNLDGRMRVGDT